jgi:hypothetical protein
MKGLILIVFMFVLIACKEEAPIPPSKQPGVCLGAVDAVAQGYKACKEPGCLCLSDVHGKEPNTVPHCHSDASKCDI